MSALLDHANEYLRLRRALGHDLAEAHRLLPDFVAHLDAIGAETVTIDAALMWAQRPDAHPATTVWARRMTVARGFARHMAGVNPHTEIPPIGLVTFRKRWRSPFIYTTADIATLMWPPAGPSPRRCEPPPSRHSSGCSPPPACGSARRSASSATTWTRPRERSSCVTRRFGKSRLVPLHSSTIDAMCSYAEKRDRLLPRPTSRTFFISTAGTRLLPADFGKAFRKLLETTGVGAGAPHAPRVHDMNTASPSTLWRGGIGRARMSVPCCPGWPRI